MIYLDDNLPSKVDKNILLIFRKKRKFPDFLYLLKYFFQMLIHTNFNFKKFYHTLSNQSCFAFQNYNILKDFIFSKKIKKILFPYEGQPFQNMIISKIKKKNRGIKSIGYIHYTHPFQLEIINRKGSPDIIYTYSPIFIVVMSVLFFKDKINLSRIIGLILCLLGVLTIILMML